MHAAMHYAKPVTVNEQSLSSLLFTVHNDTAIIFGHILKVAVEESGDL